MRGKIPKSNSVFSIEKVSRASNSGVSNSTVEYPGKKRKSLKWISNYLKKTSKPTKGRESSIKRGRWTDDEDEVLLNLFARYGMRWTELSCKMKTRNWKQIRDRFTNVLDPNLSREPYSIDEDIKIFDLHLIYGNSWREYTKYLPGRSADNIKNRFHSSVEGKEINIKLYKYISE